MALLDTLRDRAARKGGTAQVDCGELGVLTVEALAPSDCARLSGDSRSLLYAACRELQSAGEELRREGKVFRPDEITAYLTDEEADIAARTILELSGLSEIRHQSVQGLGEAFSEIRHQSVQDWSGTGQSAAGLLDGDEEIRLLSVQPFEDIVTENGQVSREFGMETAGSAPIPGADQKAQILGELSSRTAQILVSENGKDHQRGFPAKGTDGDLHETESELQRQGRAYLHEIKSEFEGNRGILLHETESESGEILHEIKSELRKALHEIKSEVREMLHEAESELAEQAAQRLAEALLRAGQVR